MHRTKLVYRFDGCVLCCAGELLEVIRLLWPQLKERAQQQIKGLVPSPGHAETLSDRLDAIIQSRRSKCCCWFLILCPEGRPGDF